MESHEKSERGQFYFLAVLFAGALLFAYSNHFQNSFHFDDGHVIEQNLNIRSIGNIPGFFSDATTFSALPANQSYRPFLSSLFAVQYALGRGSPLWFHIFAFLLYAALGIALFSLFRRIFITAGHGRESDLTALIAAGFYVLHAANAETINYVSAQSDLVSTLLMVSSLLLYSARPDWRAYGFYLIPAALAMFTKEVSVIFPLFLLSFSLLEKKVPLGEVFGTSRRKDVRRSLVAVIPSTLVCVGLLVFSSRMLPGTYVPSRLSRLEYVISQPFVLLHYFDSFLLPLNLSADTDWKPITNIFDDRVLVGVAFICMMFVAAVLSSRKDRTRPISFGILWFFLGCLPPSSGIVPLAEIMNDHRMFLPFIGLSISASWGVLLLFEKLETRFHGRTALKVGIAVFISGILAAHAYGTFQRNKVWKDEESLWHDVILKSPENARGLMNYGLALMSRGNIRGALDYFERALLISPNYAYLHINIGIAQGALGETDDAEKHFRRALSCDPGYFGGYHYYARFLQERNRTAEAVPLLKRAAELSPGFWESRYLLMRIYLRQRDWDVLSSLAEDTLKRSPNNSVARSFLEVSLHSSDPVRVEELAALADPTPEGYLRLSLAYCRESRFQECIEASGKALKLDPARIEAYNNICYAQTRIGAKSLAIKACESALAIDPDFELARNNLKLAQSLE